MAAVSLTQGVLRECEKIGDCIGGTILGWFLAAPVLFCVIGIRCCLACQRKNSQQSQPTAMAQSQATYGQAPA